MYDYEQIEDSLRFCDRKYTYRILMTIILRNILNQRRKNGKILLMIY